MTTKITLRAELPDDLVEPFLVWMRAFDKANAGCHFRVVADGGEQSVGETVSMLERVGIPLVYAGRK